MTSKRDLANQPALVPLFGGVDKKPRHLDRDVTTVGRARGCDIRLEAPEVSTLHCLLYRTAEGLRVRDCGSRTGVRVNGDLPRHNVLSEGDILQIGPFSFTVNIPPSARPDAGKLDIRRLEHCQRSRRNLIQLALHLRRRLHKEGSGDPAETELNRKAANLRNQIRHYDQRLNQLESAERDLQDDREQLQRQREGHLAHVQSVEADLAKRLEAVDQEIHDRWQEFQQRCAKDEAALAQRAKEASQYRQKLDEQVAAIDRAKSDLGPQTHHVHQAAADLRRQREENMNSKEQWVAEQGEAGAILEKQRAAMGEAEAALREQRSELGRMMGDLRELQEAIKKQQGADCQALTQENDELRRLLAESERRLAEVANNQSPDPSKELEDLKGENELLRQLLQEKDSAGPGHAVHESQPQVEGTPKEPAKPEGPPQNVDLDSYEAELNQYRQQLESDRAKLNKEIEQLRSRNEELDAATREMEMEMSKERAELARERIRLDRLREEVRSELERVQRDAGMRESLAPVNKLREEINQKKGAGKDEGNRLADRMRSVRNRLSDTPS